MNKFLLSLYIVTIALATNCSANWFDKLQNAVTPLPLQYALKQDTQHAFDKSWNILKNFIHSGDDLLVIQPNSDYSLFHVKSDFQFNVQTISKDYLRAFFPTFTNQHQRLWVIIDDPQAGSKANIPLAYRPYFDQSFMRIPLSQPVYFRDASLNANLTNLWAFKANLIEKVISHDASIITPVLILELGHLYRKAQKLDLAIKTFTLGTSYFPKNPALFRALGETFYWHCKPPQYQRSIQDNSLAHYYNLEQTGLPLYSALFNIALAYDKLDLTTEAIIQYNFILNKFIENPDDKLQSQVLRYLSKMYLNIGQTNKAISHLEADLRLNTKLPSYSYNLLLDCLAKNNNLDKYKTFVTKYFDSQAALDLNAFIRYFSYLYLHGNEDDLKNAINYNLNYMKEDPATIDLLKSDQVWWQSWTNATLSRGILPVKK